MADKGREGKGQLHRRPTLRLGAGAQAACSAGSSSGRIGYSEPTRPMARRHGEGDVGGGDLPGGGRRHGARRPRGDRRRRGTGAMSTMRPCRRRRYAARGAERAEWPAGRLADRSRSPGAAGGGRVRVLRLPPRTGCVIGVQPVPRAGGVEGRLTPGGQSAADLVRRRQDRSGAGVEDAGASRRGRRRRCGRGREAVSPAPGRRRRR